MIKNWLHIIGICGKTTSLVAKMFQDEGWFVTGSDHQYYSPASDFLIKNKINHVEGYDYKHLTKSFWRNKLNEFDVTDHPNKVIFVESITPHNKEYMFAKNKGLNPSPFSEVLGDHLVKNNSVVVVGTAGKTTTTAAIVSTAIKIGLDPSYMIGAEVIGLEDSIKNSTTDFSVIEGDEFYNVHLTKGAKFLKFKPRWGLITSLGWEHQDVYPSQELYLDAFRQFVKLIPNNGFLIFDAEDKFSNIITKESNKTCFSYSSIKNDITSNYQFDFSFDGNQTSIIIFQQNIKLAAINTKLIGEYNIKNLVATFILFNEISKLDKFKSIDLDQVAKRISEFKGVKKRLEILQTTNVKDHQIIIIDDFGVTPTRAKNSLTTLRNRFKNCKIIAIFEPIAGVRIKNKDSFLKEYSNTLNDADLIIIPELSSFNEDLLSSEELVTWMSDIGLRAKYVSNTDLIKFLDEMIMNSNSDIVICFFSGYRLTSIANDLARKYE